MTFWCVYQVHLKKFEYGKGSRVRPNFAMVRLNKIWGLTCVLSVREKKKSLHDSLWLPESLPVVQQQTHIRLISGSKPIRDSEGRTPLPLIGRGPDIPVCVCKFENVCAAAVRQRERWVVEMRAVLPT